VLAVCHPPAAQRALAATPEAGLLAPCNVVVYENEDGQAVVLAVDPLRTAAADDPALRPVAEALRIKLARVLESL
jgi:uncharacterized protein (DUF302 family)